MDEGWRVIETEIYCKDCIPLILQRKQEEKAERERIVAGLNRAFHDATDASMRNALSRAIEIVRGE